MIFQSTFRKTTTTLYSSYSSSSSSSSFRMKIFAFLIVLANIVDAFHAEIPRPRGVSLAKVSLYYPQDDGKSWTCLDGTRKITFLQVNDDYCDCPDGSDEPGTAACTFGQFHCSNLGYRSQEIPSSRVNDGICDCCDASDEYAPNAAQCENVCHELGRVEQEQRREAAELHKRGSAKRSELISRGKQLRAEREHRRAELQHRQREQQALKAEKDALKQSAEAAESEAMAAYQQQNKQEEDDQQQQQQQQQNPTEDREAETITQEAHATFLRYDANNDGIVELTELQIDMVLDRDRNGVVAIEEAKYFLDERENMDWETFLTLAWPRIKTAKMIALGIFKPPADENQESTTEGEEIAELLNEDKQRKVEGTEEHPENTESVGEDAERNENDDQDSEREEEEEDTYEEDGDADVGVGNVSEATNTTPPVYDEETQRLINLANEARNAHAEVERQLREIENEIKEIDDQNAKDYGENDEYAPLEGECFTYEEREYIYTLCPFERATQKQRSGGAETTLGRWDQWIGGDGLSKYTKQRYAHGASCWNGPQRSAIVQLHCALENKITAVIEPNRCEYIFEFETPAACDEAAHAAETERLRDEL